MVLTRPLMLLTLVLLLAFAAVPVPGAAAPPEISTHASGAALIDVQSGRLLYSYQGDKPMRIASLTKVMTAIVAIEAGRLSDVVKVGPNAFGKEGSTIYLKLGEEMSLHELLYGLMLRSGNDAATAIAEHVGGSQDGFVHLMNRKAAELGMTGTSFQNPHGLDADGHLSTANDMAKLTAYALKNPTFREIVKTKQKQAPNPNEGRNYTWHNKNKMLSLFEGADGVKTGYTMAAGRCLISSATRNGQQLAAVTLNDRDDWADHARLLEYGFRHYPLAELVKRGAPVDGHAGLVAGQSMNYPLSEDEVAAISIRTEAFRAEELSSRLGQKGRLQVLLNSQVIGTVPLYEQGSPLLRQQQRTAFLASDDDFGVSGLAEAVRAVLRALFLAGR